MTADSEESRAVLTSEDEGRIADLENAKIGFILLGLLLEFVGFVFYFHLKTPFGPYLLVLSLVGLIYLFYRTARMAGMRRGPTIFCCVLAMVPVLWLFPFFTVIWKCNEKVAQIKEHANKSVLVQRELDKSGFRLSYSRDPMAREGHNLRRPWGSAPEPGVFEA
jgi:hypothetical protein